MAVEGVQRVDAGRLRETVAAIFRAAGAPGDDALTVADALVTADARGMRSHGMVRLPIYVERVRAGGFRAGRHGRVVRDGPATMLIDGEDGLGAVLGVRAMDAAIGKARATGAGVVGVTDSNHYGGAAYYVLRAVRADVIGITTTNARPIMPAWGSRTLLSGPLPLAIGVPAGEVWPVVLDMSMAVAARGKVVHAASTGQRIPPGWGVDREGRATDDPNAVLDGGWLLPIGGYKGFGLTVMLDLLAGALTGGRMFEEMRDLYDDVGRGQGVGHIFIAIDPERFMPIDEFKRRVDLFVRRHKEAETAPGVDEVLLPGEREFRHEAEARAEGVPLAPDLLAQVRALARELKVEPLV